MTLEYICCRKYGNEIFFCNSITYIQGKSSQFLLSVSGVDRSFIEIFTRYITHILVILFDI